MKPPETETLPAELRPVARLVRVMDGLHLDPLLGLFLPWAGDFISAGVGLYPVIVAWRLRAPRVLIARMLLNLTVDVLTGLVPVLGDIWDFFFRANTRNLDLLRARWNGQAAKATWRDRLVVFAALVVFLGALSLPIVMLVLAARAVFG